MDTHVRYIQVKENEIFKYESIQGDLWKGTIQAYETHLLIERLREVEDA
jgi:hypothetical protein